MPAGRPKSTITTVKVVSGQLLLEVMSRTDDAVLAAWIRRVATDLVKDGECQEEFSAQILAEARGYRDDEAERKREAREKAEKLRNQLDRPQL